MPITTEKLCKDFLVYVIWIKFFMCGILFSNIKSLDQDKFNKALNLINHRGPDNIKYRDYQGYFLGHTRLSIIDINQRSNQPFVASDEKTIIIFNGEIYNYRELAKQFNLTLKTKSDTEVLVELYLKIGDKMLQHLNGMFSFVIFNTETKEYFVARDRLGIKPLYYYINHNEFIFSSEVSPILSIIKNYDIDEIAFRQYIKLRTFFRGHTIYKNIKMFPVASFMKNGINHQYWSLDNAKNTRFDLDKLENLIKSAVNYRLVSDVSLGCYLSGGLDSSIISYLVQPKHSWTIGFKEDNEFNYSQLLAQKYNFQHHKILIDNSEFLEISKSLIHKRKEPLSVPNETLLYKMTNIAKKYNTVILSGEGADELFLGYDRIFKWAENNEFNLKTFDKIYSYGSHQDDEILEYVLEPVMKIKNNLLKITKFFQIFHLQGLLRRLDNSTMYNSVEARVPFCDHRLVEYMYKISFDKKMHKNIIKYPLKKIFKKYLPIEIINRKKVGFPVPLTNIFNTDYGMEGWLNFNLENLFQRNIKDIKNQFKII